MSASGWTDSKEMRRKAGAHGGMAGGWKAGWRRVKAGGLRADGCSNGGGWMEDDGLDARWTDEWMA